MGDRVIYRAKIEKGSGVVQDDGPGLVFPWWSFTKVVLSTAALLLVARGRLTLDDALPGRLYTLRHLLQHRSGLPEYGKLATYHEAVERGADPWTVEELLDRVGRENFEYAPGARYAYSNIGYLFVRQLIETTMDNTIGSALRTLIFDPLGLCSVSLAVEPDDLDRTAWGNPDRYHPGWVYHGLLIGSAADAVRFLDELMAGRILPPNLLDAMKTKHFHANGVPCRPWTEFGYGLGLMIGAVEGLGVAFGHSGVGPRDLSAVYHFPECQIPCTVAAFTEGTDEGVNERAMVELATQ